jgi:hypothetical protein
MTGPMIDDNGDLRNLEIDLRGAPLRIQFGRTKTLRRAGEIIDAGMRADASGHRYLPKLAAAVSHGLRGEDEVEIGLSPSGSRNQGSLAHIIAYGSVNNLPVYDHTAALRRSTPEILELFADMSEESVLGGEK